MTGVSGGNGWQRLFEGTRLQYLWDAKPSDGYDILLIADGLSDEESIGGERRSQEMSGNKDLLEESWVQDLGATWRVREPRVVTSRV